MVTFSVVYDKRGKPVLLQATCDNCLSTTGKIETMCKGCLIPKAAPQKDKAHSRWVPANDEVATKFRANFDATVESVATSRGLKDEVIYKEQAE